jgi:predicted nucleic acid binding AN1-type Zn finger protein
MDKRLGNAERAPMECASSGKRLSAGEAGKRIKLGHGYFCFVRTTAPKLSKDDLKELAKLIPQPPKAAPKKEVNNGN